jgi:hypothetical protein
MNPYRSLPPRNFWSRGVSRGFDPGSVGTFARPLIAAGDRVMSAGSCFAANLVPYLEAQGFEYVRTERRHPKFSHLPGDNFSYDKFSAGYGNIYTVRQMLQLLQRCRGAFTPIEDRWHVDGTVIDPYRPGLKYPARSDREFNLLQQQHLEAVTRAVSQSNVFIFTLGLTEAWASRADGAVFPACPGTIAGTFDPDRHAFVNFTVAEVIADLEATIGEVRTINPDVKIILTVSPVPLVATATDQHVLAATVYSKSVLRVAAEHAARLEGVVYFPSYEIVTSPAAPERFFEADRRNVSREAIDTVMAAFLGACDTAAAPRATEPAPAVDWNARLSRTLAQVECEEAAQDAG